jgi:hypothetical protein
MYQMAATLTMAFRICQPCEIGEQQKHASVQAAVAPSSILVDS